MHLIKIKYCEDTRPQNQLSAVQEQHKGLCTILQGAFITLHTILSGVGGTKYNIHTLEPFKELGLDSQRAKTFASKLHVDYVNFFFLGGVTATAPSRDLTDNKKKRREGSSRGESKRKLLKETQNQRKETRIKKKTQVEYRVEGAQDRRRRRKLGGWKETPNTRKRGGDAQSCSC